MKAVILAGGLGTRISEETISKPKPMIEIGGKPIIWHIMKHLSNNGIKEFVVCLGYKGNLIKEYFKNFDFYNKDITVNLKSGKIINDIKKKHEDWKIHLIDTGQNTMTGGRLKRIKKLLNGKDFLFTYGDGISDINIKQLLNFHKKHKKLATITAVKPLGRYGALDIKEDDVLNFSEKPKGDMGWINGGFFILKTKCIDFIDSDETYWEKQPLERLVSKKNLKAFKFRGFWHAVDTMRDKLYLESLIKTEGKFPWLE